MELAALTHLVAFQGVNFELTYMLYNFILFFSDTFMIFHFTEQCDQQGSPTFENVCASSILVDWFWSLRLVPLVRELHYRVTMHSASCIFSVMVISSVKARFMIFNMNKLVMLII